YRRDDTGHGGGRRSAETSYRADDDYGAERDSWSAPPSPRRASEPDGESWTDQRLRARYGRPRHAPADRGERPSAAVPRREERPEPARAGRRRAPEPEPEWEQRDLEPYPGVRLGDRWAEARSDGRGRELRLGERRASVSTTDTGSHVRIEDRWAAVRRDEPAGRGDYGRRALPATPSEPTWEEGWASAPVRERQPRGGRRRRSEDLDD